jgi:hypothetical protein
MRVKKSNDSYKLFKAKHISPHTVNQISSNSNLVSQSLVTEISPPNFTKASCVDLTNTISQNVSKVVAIQSDHSQNIEGK